MNPVSDPKLLKRKSVPKPKPTGWPGYLCLVLLCLVALAPILRSDLLWSPHDAAERSDFEAMEQWTDAWTLKTIRYGDPVTASSYFLEALTPVPVAFTHRAINLILHILAAILLLKVLEVLELPGAFSAALIFAVHPVVVQPLFWPGYRTEIIVLILILLGIRFGLRNRNGTDLARMLGLTAFASILHPAALVLPPLIALCIYYQKGFFRLRDYNRLLPAVCIVFFIGIWTHSGRPAMPLPDGVDRLSLIGANVYHAAERLLAPSEPALFYPYRDEGRYSIGAQNSLIPLLLIIPIYVLIAFHLRKPWGRGLLLGLSAFLLTLLYSVTRIGRFIDKTPALEDFGLYVSLPFAVAMVVCGFTAFFQSVGTAGKLFSTGIISLVVVIQMGLTTSYTYAVGDSPKLWHSFVEQWPESAAAKTALIDSLNATDRRILTQEETIEMLLQILEKRPDQHRHRIMLARIYRSAEQNTNALREYRRILREGKPGEAFLEETAEFFDRLGLDWEASNVRERITDSRKNLARP
jgi:hypothetical protein